MASSLVDDNTLKQIRDLRTLTIETGVVTEVQADHLRLWGRVAFQFVPKEGMQCHIDQENYEVHYKLKGGRLFRKWNFFHKDKCDFNWLVGVIAALDGSVHDLLGPHWRLLITHNDKLEYEGQREKSLEMIKHEREQYRQRRNRKDER